jgi:hypothetical protein
LPCQFSIWQFGLYEGYEHVARLGFDGFGLGLLLITYFSSGYASPLQYIIVKTDFNPEEYLKIYKRTNAAAHYSKMLPRRVTLSMHLTSLIRLDR